MFANLLRRTALLLCCGLLPATSQAVQIQHWTLDNGAKVYFVESHEVPMALMRVSFDAGSSRDPLALPGLASFTSSLLDEGTAEMRSEAIAEALDRSGGSVSAFAEREQAGIVLKTLSDPALRAQVTALAVKILSQPIFPEDALERNRRLTQAAILENREDPETIAEERFSQAVYGDHPYAHPVIGSADAVTRFSRQAVLDFYQRHYQTEGAVVAIVGDLSRAEAEIWAKTLLANLPKGERLSPIAPAPAAQAKKLFIKMPVNQTSIVMGQAAEMRTDPEYFPLLVGNYTLGGGGFGSRLMEEVREKRGLSYGVYSYFAPMQQKGPFQAGLQTATAQAGAALEVMQQTIKAFLQDGPSAVELRAARDNLTGGFPLRIDANSKILDYLSLIGIYGLPLDYLDQFQRRVEQVNAAAVKKAFSSHLDLTQMVIVAVGSEPPTADFESVP